MRYSADNTTYEEVEVLEKMAFFTPVRVLDETVPEGLHRYEVRDDGAKGIPCQLKPYILANHWGTILTAGPIELEDGSRYLKDEDWSYCSAGDYTLDEVLNAFGKKVGVKCEERRNL